MNRNIVSITAFFGAVFAILFLRLVHLELVQHEKFDALAAENAAKIFAEPAPRGVIYDRFGKVMVENRPVFSVQVLPYVLSSKDKAEQDRILSKLGSLLGEKVKFKVSPNEPIFVKDNIPLQTAVRIKERERELDGVLVSSRPVRLYPHSSLAAHLLGHVGEIGPKNHAGPGLPDGGRYRKRRGRKDL